MLSEPRLHAFDHRQYSLPSSSYLLLISVYFELWLGSQIQELKIQLSNTIILLYAYFMRMNSSDCSIIL